MTAGGTPLMDGALDALLGASPERVEVLVEHGYRGTARVTARGDRLLVKWDTRDGALAREVEAHRRAGQAGVPVPKVLAFRPDPVPCIAMRWVEGEPLRGRPAGEPWRDAGRVLRIAHGAEPVLRRGVPWGRLMQDWLRGWLGYLVQHRGLGARDAGIIVEYAERLRPALDVQPLVSIHGDCQPDHFLLDAESGRVVAVLDWSDAQEGDAALDFAVLTLLDRDDRDVLPHVLDGYEASPDLREHVATTLPLYRAIRCAGAARWLDDHGFPGEEWPVDEVRRFARIAAAALHLRPSDA